MIANYHTHTVRCGHALGSEREYIEKAISLGFCELGFSDHAPMPFGSDVPKESLQKLLAMRVKLHETDDYVSTLLSLREEYKNDIKIYIGFEAEFYECCFDRFIEHISEYPIDYLILGQHHTERSNPPFIYHGNNIQSDEILTNYVNSVIKGIETEKFTYIAHPDLIFYRRDIEVYEREMTRLIQCAKRHSVPLEINLLGFKELRNYPNLVFWQIASRLGCDVVIGSDAHMPEDVLNECAYAHAMDLVRSHTGLNLLERISFKSLK